MTLKPLQALSIGLALVIAGASFAWCVDDKRLAAVQDYSDSVTTVANDRLARTDSLGAALADTVKVLVAKKTKIIVVARQDSQTVLQLDLALARAASDSERISILTAQNVVLKAETTNLWQAVALADSATAIANRRADQYQAALAAQTEELRKLNARVQGLRPRMPKWARTTSYLVTFAAGVYAGVQSH